MSLTTHTSLEKVSKTNKYSAIYKQVLHFISFFSQRKETLSTQVFAMKEINNHFAKKKKRYGSQFLTSFQKESTTANEEVTKMKYFLH